MGKRKNEVAIVCRRYPSPCGELLLGAFENRLCLCDWYDGRPLDEAEPGMRRVLNARFEEGPSEVLETAAKQLDEYFACRRRGFSVPVLFTGTDFQKRVWAELMKIPYGTTISYGTQAARMGIPKAVRAVAAANGANPISIFAPCHRVIGSNGSLTGYGGGLSTKRELLRLESETV